MKKFAIIVALVLLGLLCAGLHDGPYGAGKAQAATSSVVVIDVNIDGDTGGGKPRIGSLCSAAGSTSWCIYNDGRTGPCICKIQVICGIDTYLWMPL